MTSINSYPTFIVGGAFRTQGDKVLVQKRSWEMLRIFSDHMASPIFGMHLDPADETLEYPLPDMVRIAELPLIHGKAKLIRTAFCKPLTPEIKKIVDNCYAVYLRQPLWECWNIFRYAISKKKKILVSFHGDWPDALKKSETTTVKHFLNLALAQYIHYTFKVMARQSEVVFCVGEALQKKYGTSAKNSVVFANFLHSADDIAIPRVLNELPPYRILFVGHFEEYKGTKYLIRAVALLKQQGFNLKLVLVGTGSLEHYLRALVRKEGIEDNVEWLGYIQHGKELMAVYRKAELFVLPSIASEGTAKVLMEAMSQGVPLIATDVGNTRHLLEDGKYGIIVPSADASAIANAIRSLLDNANLRGAFIKKGLELARLSTKDRQKEIVKIAIESAMPEILGVPKYAIPLGH